MWREKNRDHPNYRRMDYVYRQHHMRFKAYVARDGFVCQSCGGAGGWVETICELGGPWMDCGWCEGTGKVSRWLRGLWLREMKRERQSRLAATV
jgi:hypothetical protein